VRGSFSPAPRPALPSEDRRAMAPAEIMASIYRGLLRQMELDKFRVFEKEYQLSKLEKAGRIAKQLLKSFLNLPPRTSVCVSSCEILRRTNL
jgi:phytoene/squalene synthetase